MSDRNIPTEDVPADPVAQRFAALDAVARVSVFPYEMREADGSVFYTTGLTKRELFAAMAMQGFCSAEWTEDRTEDTIAALAVGQADALLAALDKTLTGNDPSQDRAKGCAQESTGAAEKPEAGSPRVAAREVLPSKEQVSAVEALKVLVEEIDATGVYLDRPVDAVKFIAQCASSALTKLIQREAQPVETTTGHVKLPTNADEAAAMVLAGHSWLHVNAPERLRKADGYAYRYPTSDGSVIRFSNGGTVNGSAPIEAIPYYYGNPVEALPHLNGSAEKAADEVPPLTLRDFGYAPGDYTCRCFTCERDFTGDKRAIQCERCASERLARSQVKTSVPLCDPKCFDYPRCECGRGMP